MTDKVADASFMFRMPDSPKVVGVSYDFGVPPTLAAGRLADRRRHTMDQVEAALDDASFAELDVVGEIVTAHVAAVNGVLHVGDESIALEADARRHLGGRVVDLTVPGNWRRVDPDQPDDETGLLLAYARLYQQAADLMFRRARSRIVDADHRATHSKTARRAARERRQAEADAAREKGAQRALRRAQPSPATMAGEALVEANRAAIAAEQEQTLNRGGVLSQPRRR